MTATCQRHTISHSHLACNYRACRLNTALPPSLGSATLETTTTRLTVDAHKDCRAICSLKDWNETTIYDIRTTIGDVILTAGTPLDVTK